MDIDCGANFDYDNDTQEEFLDDGYYDDQDGFQDHEPRKRFSTKWQVVLSLRTLPDPDQKMQTIGATADSIELWLLPSRRKQES